MTELQFTRAFTASAAIAKFARVTLASTGLIATAALDEEGIGHAAEPAFAAGDTITVYLDGPIRRGIAIEALAIGARVHGEASGKIQDTAAATSFPLGIALQAATADGDEIEYVSKALSAANA